MGNKIYKVLNEVVVSNEATTINALEYVKNIIYNNLDNKTINKLIVEKYCNYCVNKMVSKTSIDFNKLIIKTKKDYTCNLPEWGINKNKFKINDLSDCTVRIEKNVDLIINNAYLQCLLHIGDIICISLSPYYSIDDFDYYKDGFKITFKEVYKNKKDFIGIDIVFESNEFNGGEAIINSIVKLR